MTHSLRGRMPPSEAHLPDRICSVVGNHFYHPIFSKLLAVYLNDICVDYAVEACRSEGWVIKYEMDDTGHITTDHYGKACFVILKGSVHFYERKHEREQVKVFFSDYTW